MEQKGPFALASAVFALAGVVALGVGAFCRATLPNSRHMDYCENVSFGAATILGIVAVLMLLRAAPGKGGPG